MASEQITLVVVDDDGVDQYLVKRTLQQLELNLQLLTFDAGDSFLQALTQGDGLSDMFNLSPWPILVLLDIKMPRMSGFEVLAALDRLIATKPGIMAVAMQSSSSNPGDRARALQYDFVHDYLVKPLQSSDLQRFIRQQHREGLPPLSTGG